MEVEKRTWRSGRWEVETDRKGGGEYSNWGILGANKDPMSLVTIEYSLIFHSRFTQWA